MVLAAGIEPALDYSKQILSLARLPIPPREHTASALNVCVGELQMLD